jgi:hypothetical protein
MTGAVLQGTPVTTLDVDLWIDLQPRQYMRMINLARRIGAEMISNTVVVLPGAVTVNFIFEVTGLETFSAEYRRSRPVSWVGHQVRVLPLERIYASKKAVGRPKDVAHLPLLEQTMRVRKAGMKGTGA